MKKIYLYTLFCAFFMFNSICLNMGFRQPVL